MNRGELAGLGLSEKSGTGQEQIWAPGPWTRSPLSKTEMLLRTWELLQIQATVSEYAVPCSQAEITTSCSNPIEKPIQKRVSL